MDYDDLDSPVLPQRELDLGRRYVQDLTNKCCFFTKRIKNTVYIQVQIHFFVVRSRQRLPLLRIPIAPTVGRNQGDEVIHARFGKCVLFFYLSRMFVH